MAVKLVRDLMHIGVPTCLDETRLVDAVRILLRDNLEALIILDRNAHAVGVLGRREVVAAYARTGALDESLTVGDVMNDDIPEVPPDIPAATAAQLMLDQGVRELYLMHRSSGIGWPAAVLRLEDVLNHVDSGSKMEDDGRKESMI